MLQELVSPGMLVTGVTTHHPPPAPARDGTTELRDSHAAPNAAIWHLHPVSKGHFTSYLQPA